MAERLMHPRADRAASRSSVRRLVARHPVATLATPSLHWIG
jgi:hypothetical protein